MADDPAVVFGLQLQDKWLNVGDIKQRHNFDPSSRPFLQFKVRKRWFLDGDKPKASMADRNDEQRMLGFFPKTPPKES